MFFVHSLDPSIVLLIGCNRFAGVDGWIHWGVGVAVVSVFDGMGVREVVLL